MPDPKTAELVERLGAISLFHGLDAETLTLLASDSERRTVQPGEFIFVEGEKPRGLYVLESGWARAVKMSAQGREQVLQFVGPGEPFNTVSIFTTLPNPASAMALEESVVWVVPLVTVERVLRERPEFSQRVLQNMAERMIYLVGLVADLSLRTVIQRLANLLLERATGGVLARPKWFTLAELAARLGTVPDVVQRAMGRLQSEGIIDVTRREIRVLDEARLRQLAERA
ncbi:MAG TPA: Crp/Fnr family transcriptional regulator [Tepidiformaceae bacterium]